MILGIDASRANRRQKTGVEHYAYELIQEFKKIIPENVQVILYTDEPLRGDLAQLPKNWQEKVLHWPPKFLWTHFRLSIELLLHRPDVYFIPAHVMPFISRGKAVVTIHDVAYKVFPSAYTRKGRFYLNTLTHWQKWRAKKIITISHAAKADIIKYYKILAEKIAITPLAYNAKIYRQISDEVKTGEILAKYRIIKPFFLSISRLEIKKNTDGIIRAFELCQPPARNALRSVAGGPTANSYQLVLVGKPGKGYAKVKAVLDTSPAKERIIAPGWVAESDVPYLMNAATAFVFPSFYEGFGIPILEAMACGCPVITANTTACPEVAGDAALLVDPQNIKQISEAMKKIINDKNLQDDLKNRGLARAKNFSWETTAKKTAEILLNL